MMWSCKSCVNQSEGMISEQSSDILYKIASKRKTHFNELLQDLGKIPDERPNDRMQKSII